MREIPLSIPAGPFSLEGCLTLPATAHEPSPVVLLLHPWGAWDQDGSLPADFSADGSPIRLFEQLTAAFVPAGFGTFRYSNRFATCSGPTDPRFSELTFTGLVKDSREAVALLRRMPEVDPERIWLLGISLGTEVAMAVAESDPSLAGLCLLAPLGESYRRRRYYLDIERKVDWLWHSGLVSPDGLVDLATLQTRAAERAHWWDLEPELTEGDPLPYEEVLAILKAHHEAAVERLVTEGDNEAPAVWWRQWLENPPTHRRLRSYPGPVLILVGEDDNTTPPRETFLLLKGVGPRPNLQWKLLPRLGHIFSARRADGSRTYGPLAPEAVAAVVEYLR